MQNLTGSVLVQRFRLDVLEGQGEPGDVYRGLDLKRNLAVAITVLRRALPHDPTVLSFQHDNLTLQTLTHRNIAPFYGLYQDQNIGFFVERYVDGPNLQELMRERGGQPVSVRDAIIYLKSLCQGLGYAHRFGLVHCHVQPTNVRIDNEGHILLAGFGFARTTESAMTSTGIFGVPAYLAPEEIRREIVTPATDIYGLGLIMFELLTGQHPFISHQSGEAPDDIAQALLTAHLLQPAPDPSSINPAIPAGLAQVIHTALEKDPKDRYQNTQEMLEIACAVTGYSPDQVPDHFISPTSTEVTVIGMPPLSRQPLPPPTPSTQVVTGPPVVQPVRPANPPPAGSPPMRTILVESARSSGGGYPGEAYAQPDESPRKRRGMAPLAVAAAAALGGLLCLAIIAALALPALRGSFLPAAASVTPSPTAATSTVAATMTSTLNPTRELIPGVSNTITPVPSDTPAPTFTMLPSPTFTEAPLPAARTAFTVTIRNNLGYEIYAFRDNILMGTDPIPPARYIFYRNIPAGVHVFKFCQDVQGQVCGDPREVNVNRDLTIALP